MSSISFHSLHINSAYNAMVHGQRFLPSTNLVSHSKFCWKILLCQENPLLTLVLMISHPASTRPFQLQVPLKWLLSLSSQDLPPDPPLSTPSAPPTSSGGYPTPSSFPHTPVLLCILIFSLSATHSRIPLLIPLQALCLGFLWWRRY